MVENALMSICHSKGLPCSASTQEIRSRSLRQDTGGLQPANEKMHLGPGGFTVERMIFPRLSLDIAEVAISFLNWNFIVPDRTQCVCEQRSIRQRKSNKQPVKGHPKTPSPLRERAGVRVQAHEFTPSPDASGWLSRSLRRVSDRIGSPFTGGGEIMGVGPLVVKGFEMAF